MVGFDERECETEWGEFNDLVWSKCSRDFLMLAEAGLQGCSDKVEFLETSMRVSLYPFPRTHCL